MTFDLCIISAQDLLSVSTKRLVIYGLELIKNHKIMDLEVNIVFSLVIKFIFR